MIVQGVNVPQEHLDMAFSKFGKAFIYVDYEFQFKRLYPDYD